MEYLCNECECHHRTVCLCKVYYRRTVYLCNVWKVGYRRTVCLCNVLKVDYYRTLFLCNVLVEFLHILHLGHKRHHLFLYSELLDTVLPYNEILNYRNCLYNDSLE